MDKRADRGEAARDDQEAWTEALPDGARPKRHEDDEGFDRIEIVATPRYKTSHMSGDEWRTGAMIRFYRQGEVVAEKFRTNMKAAIRHLPWLADKAPMETESALYAPDDDVCFQPGCDREPVSTYLLDAEFCVGGGNCGQEMDRYRSPVAGNEQRYYRRFCDRHLRRGDCGLEDADRNYTVVDGPGPEGGRMDPDDVSESGFAGVVSVDLEAPDAD